MHKGQGLPVITRAQYNSIHKDYRGIWESMRSDNRPEMTGKRVAFSGSLNGINSNIPYYGGTTILFEGEDFLIRG